jgi:hypothetical protein
LGVFDKSSRKYGKGWHDYIEWSKLTHLTEVVSLDCRLKTINNNGDTIETYVYSYKYDAKGNITYIERYFVEYTDSIPVSNDRFEYSDTVNFTTSADMMYPDKVSRNANLVREEHHDSYYMPSALSHHYYYKYEFDEHKRIKVITVVEKEPLSGIIINTITYTYLQ